MTPRFDGLFGSEQTYRALNAFERAQNKKAHLAVHHKHGYGAADESKGTAEQTQS